MVSLEGAAVVESAGPLASSIKGVKSLQQAGKWRGYLQCVVLWLRSSAAGACLSPCLSSHLPACSNHA